MNTIRKLTAFNTPNLKSASTAKNPTAAFSLTCSGKYDQDIICVDYRASLRTYYNAIYMLGMLFGSFIFGWISDTYGRMNSLLIAVTTVSLSGFFG